LYEKSLEMVGLEKGIEPEISQGDKKRN